MGKVTRRILAEIGKITLAISLVFGVFLGYGFYSESNASKQAEAFCQSIEVGSEVQSLQNRAIEAGADSHKTKWFTLKNQNPQLLATFTGATPLSRYICWIEAKDGRVLSRSVSYLD